MRHSLPYDSDGCEHTRFLNIWKTGIHISRLCINSQPIANNILQELKQEIIGQDQALEKLSIAIQRGYSLLKEPNKPLGAYLFSGPSGVGKTLTAKTLAKVLFGSNNALIRLDMSEFSERFTISKLIGAPAGYVGYQESGHLTNTVKQQPLSVVLFDEIEKAHPDIFNILFQILDEGYLRDGKGHNIDFRQTIIILTTNLGIKELYNSVGFTGKSDDKSTNSSFNSAIKEFFRLELLNRFDDVIHFQTLGISQRRAIIKQKVNNLNSRISNHLQIQISQEAIEHIVNNFYKEEQGVRSLEKIIRESIEIPLSQTLYKYKKGSMIKVDISDEQVVIK